MGTVLCLWALFSGALWQKYWLKWLFLVFMMGFVVNGRNSMLNGTALLFQGF